MLLIFDENDQYWVSTLTLTTISTLSDLNSLVSQKVRYEAEVLHEVNDPKVKNITTSLSCDSSNLKTQT